VIFFLFFKMWKYSKVYFPEDKVSPERRCHAGLHCYQADSPTASRFQRMHLTNDIMYDKILSKLQRF